MKRVLVYGGAGQLGEAVVAAFNAAKIQTYSVDLRSSKAANHSIVLSTDSDFEKSIHSAESKIQELGVKFDSVICTAGGWEGGGLSSSSLIGSLGRQWRCNVESAVASAQLADKYLTDSSNGLLVLTGSAAALTPTSSMISYGIAKAAVHHLTLSVAEGWANTERRAVALLPITLDTPTNRAAMPTADYSTWTPLSFVADLLVNWVSGSAPPPPNGSLLKVVTTNSNTQLVSIQDLLQHTSTPFDPKSPL